MDRLSGFLWFSNRLISDHLNCISGPFNCCCGRVRASGFPQSCQGLNAHLGGLAGPAQSSTPTMTLQDHFLLCHCTSSSGSSALSALYPELKPFSEVLRNLLTTANVRAKPPYVICPNMTGNRGNSERNGENRRGWRRERKSS